MVANRQSRRLQQRDEDDEVVEGEAHVQAQAEEVHEGVARAALAEVPESAGVEGAHANEGGEPMFFLTPNQNFNFF